MPDQPTLAQFRATMLAAGYDEVLERVWAPDTVVDTHTIRLKPMPSLCGARCGSAKNGRCAAIVASDHFHLQAHAPHSERYGPEGADVLGGARRS